MAKFFQDVWDVIVNSLPNQPLTEFKLIVTLVCAAILGLVIALGYVFTSRKTGYASSFVTSLVILPTVIAAIIMMIGSNLAGAISLGGVFALIRFRSEPGNPRDITYVSVTMAAGLACGLGYIIIGAIIVAFVMAVFCLIMVSGLGVQKSTAVVLKITIPEDIDFETAFDDIFDQYTKYHKLDRVKTADFGALFQLQYRTELKDSTKKREFLDALRTVNSNLTVAMSSVVYEEGRKTF